MAQDLGTAMLVGRGHARLGPSGAHRWLFCTGSVNAEEGMKDTAGLFAAEGTAFHEWAADCLEIGLEPQDLYGAEMEVEGFHFIMSEDMGRHMVSGLERVRREAENSTLYVETLVDTSRWLGPDQFGTADVIIVQRYRKRIVIFDWKYGRGVPVGAKNNAQLKLYALGAIAFLNEQGIYPTNDWEVLTIIEQPRHHLGGGEWKTTVGDLLAFGEWAGQQAAETRRPDAPRTAGEEQCEYCKAKARCQTFADWNYETMQFEFDEEAAELDVAQPLPDILTLSPEHRVAIYRNKSLIEKWLKAIHASLLVDYSRGDPTPGLKMVDGRMGKREYKPGHLDEIVETLEDYLEDMAYEKKLLTPAKAEAALGRKTYEKALAKFVRQGDPKPALVAADDVRPARQTLDEKFDEDGEEDPFEIE